MRTFTVNIPSLPVLVRKQYLNPKLEGFEKAYLMTATAISGRPLFLDDYFTDNDDHSFPNYRRQEKYWMPGG